MAFDLLEHKALSANTTTVTFATINQTYYDLRLWVNARGTTNSNRVRIYLAFNGDTTATNYRSVSGYWDAGSLGAEANDTTYQGRLCGVIPAANLANSTIYSAIEMRLFDYKDTATQKAVFIHSGQPGTSSASYSDYVTHTVWKNTAAISSISLTCEAGDFLSGSDIYLYGQK